MYSLTQATKLLLDSYNLGTNNSNKAQINTYNTHKVRHTFGVLETGRNLIIKIKENIILAPDIINKAEICFILHDIGRFYQNDGENVLENKDYEHGDKSYEIVKDNDYSSDICLAIKYHNKFEINGIFDEKEYLEMNDLEKKDTIFLLNILKDADKLQNIIYSVFDAEVFLKTDKTAQNTTDGDITEINLIDFKNHKLIFRSNIKTLGDYYLGTLSFIFDLNFQESIEMLKFYNYLDKSIKEIEKSSGVSNESMEIIRKSINKYL